MLRNIKWFQVAIVFAVLTLIAVAGIFIGLIKPMNERLAAANTKLETQTTTYQEATGNGAKGLNAAKKDKEKAVQEVAVAQAAWAGYDRRLMPNIDLSNRFTATHQLWNEQRLVLGPKVLKFLYADRSVKVVSEQIAIPAPTGDPNTVVQRVYTYPLGNVTVSGRFEDVLRNTERWNRFERLALVDGLTLAGNSPVLTGTYNVTLYEFSHADKVGPEIPQAGAPTGGGGGGFPGGPPPGFQGGGFPGSFPGGGPGSFGPPPGIPGGGDAQPGR